MGELPSAVLFCCTSNAIRSVMAEGIMKRLFGNRLYVTSVGVRKGERDPFVTEVMDEIGIDTSKHNPKSFDELDDGSFDLVISLSPEAQHTAVELTRTSACDVEYWPTFDPSIAEGSRDSRLDAYRTVRDDLMRRIQQRFPVHGLASLN